MEQDYSLSDDQVSLFTETFLLFYLHKTTSRLDVLLDSENQCLDTFLQKLLAKKLIEIDSSHHYILSATGVQKVESFSERYHAHLAYFDIFAHVDIAAGEFALSSKKKYPQESSWFRFLGQSRWEDLRIAILDYLDGNPLEFIFAQFVMEERIDTAKTGWQLELTHGQFWQDIVDLANSHLDTSDLSNIEETNQESPLIEQIIEHGFSELEKNRPDDKELNIFWKNWEQEEHTSQYASAALKKNFWIYPWSLQ